MKTILAKYLLVIYLFSATELNQLLKLPILFSHFIEHKQFDASKTFIDFLYHHYAIEHNDDGDANTDNKLPFKSHNQCFSFIFPISILQTIQLSQLNSIVIEQKNAYFSTSSNILSSYLSSIWQPPKF